MLILGMDTSGKYASCALMEDGNLLGEICVGTSRAHSQVILPLVKRLLNDCGRKTEDIDGYAVVTGPGSYTGLRIGIGAVKGLCFGAGKPCGGVSALEAIAANFCGALVCSVMHARQDLYYAAFFETDISGDIKRQGTCRDRIIPLTELAGEIRAMSAEKNRPVICAGDGCYDAVNAAGELGNEKFPDGCGAFAAPCNMHRPSPAGICRIAEKQGLYTPEMLTAEYMQITKAEKDLLQETRG